MVEAESEYYYYKRGYKQAVKDCFVIYKDFMNNRLGQVADGDIFKSLLEKVSK